MISERQKHYRSIDCALDFFDSDSESDADFDDDATVPPLHNSQNNEHADVD